MSLFSSLHTSAGVKRRRLPLLVTLLATIVGTAALAAPGIYPTGVTRYDPSKAYNSYVLFTGQDKKTHLIDLDGNEVHQWPYEGFPPVLLDPALSGGKLGNILLQLSNQQGDQAAGNGLRNQSVGELDWDGKVVWQWAGVQARQTYGGNNDNDSGTAAKQHHDWRRLPNGNTVVLVNYVHTIPGFKADKVLDDAVYEVSPKGEVVWKWVAGDHLDEFGFSAASLKLIRNTLTRNDKTIPFDYLHINDMAVLGLNKWFDAGDARFNPDNILINSRNANVLVIIDKKSGKIVWRLGPDYENPTQARGKLPRPVDQLLGEHDAHIIPPGLPGAGNLLVFDNQGEAGYPRVGPGTQPGSRVLEIDPVKKEIVWQYTGIDSGRPAYSFYSSYISSARRLPNGNTLVDEGMNGRIFQITPQGEIVWEYVSPYFSAARAGADGAAVNNTVYRAQPVPYNWVPAGTPHAETAIAAPDIRKLRVPGAQ